jgi:plasmid stabilization system protein ParE
MSLPIIFRRDARREFDQAYDWYEKHKAKLGEEFSESVHKVLERIAAHPQIHQCVYQDVRRAVLERFPYCVFYRVEKTRIRILAVFHTRRDPTIWQART